MTKEDIIQNAWTEIQSHINAEGVPSYNEDGWAKYGGKQKSEYFKTLEEKQWLGYFFYRPKSLEGIEDNNGWELIDDLDIEDNEHVLFLRMTEGGEAPIFTCPAGEDFQIGYFTHWKRIDISKPPLFDSY